MRSHKSPSCMERSNGMSTFSKKYYSTEQVMNIIKSTVSQKLNRLYQELEQKQNIIKILNEKLNKNEQKLEQQSRLIQKFLAKTKEGNHEMTLNMINKLLNEKMQHSWTNTQGKIEQIRRNIKQAIEKINKRSQKKIQTDLYELKKSVSEQIDTFKKKNNAYWLKVKEALNKINGKSDNIEEKISKITSQSQKFNEEKKQNRDLLRSLQQGKKAAKNFVQLKKSIENVYQNYKQMLTLQNQVKNQYEENSLSIICQQENRKTSRQKTESDFIILEYSKEDQTDSMLYKETGLTEDYYGIQKKQIEVLSPLKTSKSNPKRGREPNQQKEQTSLWSFNQDLYTHSRTVNLSTDQRKQMCENIKQRLLELIREKGLRIPLKVSLDKANYLKDEDGLHMFDLQKNMFKINPYMFSELQNEGILAKVRVEYKKRF